MKTRFPSAPIAWALLLSPAFALPQAEPFGQYHGYPWPTSPAFTGGINSEAFRRGCAGDFDGDHVLDAVVVDGKQPVLLVAPDRTNGLLEVMPVLAANDVAVLPGGAPGTGFDALLVVNANGLFRLSWDPASTVFGAPVEIGSGSAWDKAKELAVGDLDADGDFDIVGIVQADLDHDGFAEGHVRVLLAHNGGFVQRPGFAVWYTLYHVALAEFDGDPELEIALSSSYGARVYDVNGNYVQGLPLPSQPGPLGGLCAIRVAPGAKERLALVTPDFSQSTQALYVYEHSTDSGYQPWTISLGSLRVVGCAAADQDGDGDDDLFVSHQQNHELRMLKNLWNPQTPGAPLFSPAPLDSKYFRLAPPADVGTSAGANEARPVLGDFDGDGDVDIVMPVEGHGAVTKHVQVIRGDEYDEALSRVDLSRMTLYGPAGTDPPHALLELVMPESIPAGATHLDVVVWKQPGPAAKLASDAVAHLRYDLPSGGIGVILPLPDESSDVFDAIYKVQIALVGAPSLLADPTIVFPTFTGALVANSTSKAAILAESDSGDEYTVHDPVQIARSDAGFIEKPDVKPFEEGDVPKPPAPVEGNTGSTGS